LEVFYGPSIKLCKAGSDESVLLEEKNVIIAVIGYWNKAELMRQPRVRDDHPCVSLMMFWLH
jgi:hypothetical protein